MAVFDHQGESIAVAATAHPVRLGPQDLRTFNEFLLQLSKAGVPVERGLALLASELQTSKLKQSIEALVADLEAGQPLEKAIAARRETFPPLYSSLIDAGIQSGDLPAILQQFGRHMDDMAELRDSVWRALAYPVIVFVSLLLLMTLLGYVLLPSYFASIEGVTWKVFNFNPKGMSHESIIHGTIPLSGWIMLVLGKAAPLLLLLIAAGAAGMWWATQRARAGRGDRRWIDRVALRLPIIGSAMRDSYLASWLDVMTIGITAGLDLPRSLRLAGAAVDLPSLSDDGEALCQQLEHGRSAAGATLTRLPATVPLAIDVAAANANLPRTLAGLVERYRVQAERNIRLIPGRVMPALLICIGLLAGGVMYSLWMPMVELLKMLGLGGPSPFSGGLW